MTFMLVFGSYGGFSLSLTRICLGWVALTFIPIDLEDALNKLVEREKKCRCGAVE